MQRFLLAIVLTLVYTGIHAQSNTFHCKADQGNAITLLRNLVAYTGFNIEYSPGLLDNNIQVSLPAGEMTLEAALQIILKGQPVRIIEHNGKVMLVAPERFVINGYVQQEHTLEPLPFAVIRVENYITQSNGDGYFTMVLPAGIHTLQVSFTGSATKKITVDLQQHTHLNISLPPATLPEVQVAALKGNSGIKLDRYQSSMYSNMLGETDPVGAVYLLPGNMESQQSGGKLLVRGGDPAHSILLLDGNQIFNPAHLLGEVAVLGNTSIRSVQQFKNDFPARLGGGLSSITEISTKDGNMDRWSGEGQLGLNSLSFTLEGPLKKERTAIMISGRQSLGDATNQDIFAYDANFGDSHLKLTHRLNDNNKLLLGFYIGNDLLKLTQDEQEYMQRWKNLLLTTQWNHIVSRRLFINTAFHLSSYDNYTGLMYKLPDETPYVFNNYTAGTRLEGRTQGELMITPNVQLRVGGKIERNEISYYNTLMGTTLHEYNDSFQVARKVAYTNVTLFYEHEFKLSPKLLIRPGIHYNSHFAIVQPRFFTAFQLNHTQQLTIAYAKTGLLLHQVNSPYFGINRDVWVPATERLLPEAAHMINLGYQYRDPAVLNLTADVYYRHMDHITTFAPNSNVLFSNDSIEKDVISGRGWSYGTELMAEQQCRKWKWMLAYTLSWSWREFEGKTTPYRYDRRHNLNALLEYQPAKRFLVNVLYHFNTGDWLRIPARVSSIPGSSLGDAPPFRGPVGSRINFNGSYSVAMKSIQHRFSAGISFRNQSAMPYSTEILTPENKEYEIPGAPAQLFDMNLYITYNIRF